MTEPAPPLTGSADIGVYGLAVMGANLALNIADKGFTVALFNRTEGVAQTLAARESGPTRQLAATASVEEFVASLNRPRRIILMVKAGPPVDAVIQQLLPLLDDGDIIVDGGNSHYPDTERRAKEVAATGKRFVGMGISGGEEGARHGPSLMPGGDGEAFGVLEPVLNAIAARCDSGPCVAHMGRGAAGHFVKMVHNGIEYADMQLIAEAYSLLRDGAGMSSADISGLFSQWNTGRLASYLIEITSEIVNRRDPETGELMTDVIVDRAGQKGTGIWTSTAAMGLGVPVPTITAAVDARLMSAMKDNRVEASLIYGDELPRPAPPAEFPDLMEAALYAAKVCCYAQGFALLGAASEAHNYGTSLSEVARIWKAGCIIRAALLDRVRTAFDRPEPPPSLIMDADFAAELKQAVPSLRAVVAFGAVARIPLPAFASALAWFDSMTASRLPAYLIQAQRDYFGAHTFERLDKGGVFHFDWNPE